MSREAEVQRPRRADVAASYDLGVEAYAALWSPVILPPARSVVAAMELGPGARVIDIGTGAGALVPALQGAAADVTVVGLDASLEMLRAAQQSVGVATIQSDALALPIRDASVDAALVAFVLFHLNDPAVAVVEVAKVLAGGGRVGTVTWVCESAIRAYEVWDSTLSEAGAGALAARRVDVGLDTRDGIDALFAGAGLELTDAWTEPVSRHWDPSTYWQLQTGSGLNRLRLRQIDPAARREVLERARQRLDALPPDAFAYRGEVLCAVAAKPSPRS